MNDVMDETAIDVRSLGKRYRVDPGREFWALRDVDFRARRGEALAIIGSNGAGKSTLLKILSRVTEPTTGRAEIRGRVSSLLEVGTGFHPELSGRENVYLNAAILGMRKAEIDRRLDAIVAFADVGAFLEMPIKRYSSGMRMRLAFAVAAHLDSEILIVDEVLAVGDASFQRKCMGTMSDLAQRGRTVLLVSHNLVALPRLCSRGLVISEGRIVADGGVAEAIDTYLGASVGTPNVRGWIETLPRPRPELGERIRLLRAELLDAAGNPTDALRFGEAFSVRVQARAGSDLKDLSVVVGVDGPDGARIATALSEESGCLFEAKPGELLSAQATFRGLHLQPGTYSLSLSIRSAQQGLDGVAGFSRFRVSRVSAAAVPPPTAVLGYLRWLAEWHTPDDPEIET
jgi:lipopolysaccharide transport system ATP-binding protein